MPAGFAPGCDLELVQPHDDIFIQDYFTDGERAAVAQVPPEERPLHATLIWCAKESALKCLREGLRRDTRSVVVALSEDRHPVWNSFTVTCRETSCVFRGWWRRSGDYMLTIAADVPIQPPVDLRG